MPLRTSKDKIGVATVLNVGTELRLNIRSIGVAGYLLKLIDGNNAMMAGLLEKFENLVERSLRVFHGAHTYSPRRLTKNIECDIGPQRSHNIDESLHDAFTFWLECLDNALAQGIDKLAQRGRRINIDHKCVVLILDFILSKTVLDEIGFTKATR